MVKKQIIEKKLILCGILAIAIGIAAIVPVEHLMAPQTQVSALTNFDKSWFNVSVPYAYWTANFAPNQEGISYGEGYYLALNITTNPDAINTLPDARMEYYQIQVYSDIGSIENFTFVICADCTGSTNPYISLTYSLSNYFNAGDIINGSQTNTNLPDREWVFLPNFNGTLPTTNQPSWQSTTSYQLIAKNQAISGISESFSNGLAIQGINMTGTYMNKQLQQISNIQNAHAIYIDISRIGYVTIDGNSAIVTAAVNSFTQHTVLTPYKGGFLYNTVIPQDQLSQTNLESPTFP